MTSSNPHPHSRDFDRAERIGDDHVGTSVDTPLRPDAFLLDDQEKMARIEPLFREIMKSGSLRYVYNPTSQTVTLFLVSGNVTLEWNEGLKCLEGDLLDQDYLSICTRGATPTPGS